MLRNKPSRADLPTFPNEQSRPSG